MPRPKINIIGQKFGKLTVIESVGVTHHHKQLVKCRCDCGSHKTVRASNLKTGNVRSCSCLRAEQRRMRRYANR